MMENEEQIQALLLREEKGELWGGQHCGRGREEGTFAASMCYEKIIPWAPQQLKAYGAARDNGRTPPLPLGK